MEGWGDEDRLDPLSLFQHGINKVHTGEGGDALRGIYCHRSQPIKERCHPLGHPHGIGFCVHHMPRGCRSQERGDHQWVD